MKVYRIWNVTRQSFITTNAVSTGIYLKESSAKKALAQLKRKRYYRESYIVIFEFELTNKKEII